MSEDASMLDYILNLRNWNHYVTARAELAALRDRVAELDAARALAGVLDGVSLSDWLRDELSSAADCRERVKELEASTVLTPRQCAHGGRDCFERGWQAAIEAAADLLLEHHKKLMLVADGDPFTYDGFAASAVKVSSQKVRALQPPPDCDCNPLDPDATGDHHE